MGAVDSENDMNEKAEETEKKVCELPWNCDIAIMTEISAFWLSDLNLIHTLELIQI